MLARKRGRGEGSKKTGLGACRIKPYKENKELERHYEAIFVWTDLHKPYRA